MSESHRFVEQVDHIADEQERNRRLAERIANGTDAMSGEMDQMINLIEQMAKAHLDIPGPRTLQLIEEIRRLRAEGGE